MLVHRAGRTLSVAPFGEGVLGIEEGWHCPELGTRRRTQVLTLRGRGRRTLSGFALGADPAPRPGVRLEGDRIRVRAGSRDHARRAP